jgi:hypothetical protein
MPAAAGPAAGGTTARGDPLTKRIALLAAGLAAAASFTTAAPASAAEPPCFSQDVNDCFEPVRQVCIYLLGTCHLGA